MIDHRLMEGREPIQAAIELRREELFKQLGEELWLMVVIRGWLERGERASAESRRVKD